METWDPWIGSHPNYYTLPQDLAQALKDYKPDTEELRPLDTEFFCELLGDVLTRAAKSVLDFGPPAYHNGRHFAEVVANARLLLEAMEEPVPETVKQALLLAAAGHDFAHQGATFRKDAVHGVPRPDLGTEIATEEFSAMAVDDLLRRSGVSLAPRLFIARAIHATTFGNPAISPQSPLEKLLACADVAPNTPQLIAWLEQGIDVTFHERPAKPAPTTFTGWIANRLGFIEFYLMNFVDPAKPQYVSAAVRLGWDAILKSHLVALKRVKDGNDPVLAAIMKSMLPADRVDLET